MVLLLTPFILSFSLGVISAVLVAIGITFLGCLKKLIVKPRVQTLLFISLLLGVVCMVALVIFLPDNTLFLRAGAGVVAASNPESELQEVNNKLNALKAAIEKAGLIG